jgi:hypothetical protein
MPCYDFQCVNCLKINKNVIVNSQEKIDRVCTECEFPMTRLFPTIVHTNINHIMDSKDRGKVVSEKNAKLKKLHAGYEHEEQNMRKSITKQVNEKRAKEKK